MSRHLNAAFLVFSMMLLATVHHAYTCNLGFSCCPLSSNITSNNYYNCTADTNSTSDLNSTTGICVDFSSDYYNCGVCGRVCNQTFENICNGGICSLQAVIVNTVVLGNSESFAVLAGSTVTGPSVIAVGDLGVSPGSSLTGFTTAYVEDGGIYAGDSYAYLSQTDLTAAYKDAAGRTLPAAMPADLTGLTLVPGVYKNSISIGWGGTLTLDAQNNTNAVFIFQISTTLVTASGSSVDLINGASACNVFWQVGSSATLGSGTSFSGTILADQSITVNSGCTVLGRLLAQVAEISLDSSTVTRPECDGANSTVTNGTGSSNTSTAGDITSTTSFTTTTNSNSVTTTSTPSVASTTAATTTSSVALTSTTASNAATASTAASSGASTFASPSSTVTTNVATSSSKVVTSSTPTPTTSNVATTSNAATTSSSAATTASNAAATSTKAATTSSNAATASAKAATTTSTPSITTSGTTTSTVATPSTSSASTTASKSSTASTTTLHGTSTSSSSSTKHGTTTVSSVSGASMLSISVSCLLFSALFL